MTVVLLFLENMMVCEENVHNFKFLGGLGLPEPPGQPEKIEQVRRGGQVLEMSLRMRQL